MRCYIVSFCAVLSGVARIAQAEVDFGLLRREVPETSTEDVAQHEGGEQHKDRQRQHQKKIEREAVWAERIERHNASSSKVARHEQNEQGGAASYATSHKDAAGARTGWPAKKINKVKKTKLNNRLDWGGYGHLWSEHGSQKTVDDLQKKANVNADGAASKFTSTKEAVYNWVMKKNNALFSEGTEATEMSGDNRVATIALDEGITGTVVFKDGSTEDATHATFVWKEASATLITCYPKKV